MAALTTEDIVQELGSYPNDAQRWAIYKALGYVPSPEQAAFHFLKHEDGSPVKYKIGSGGEQAGKSFSAEKELVSFVPFGQKYWIVGPDYRQSHNEFDYLVEDLSNLGALKSRPIRPDKGMWRLETVWGTEVKCLSAENVMGIAGEAPDGILLVEAAQCLEEVYLRCVGRTGPKDGWLCINGTFEGEHGAWYRRKWNEWQGPNLDLGRSVSLPSWSNRKFYPGGREDPKILRLEQQFRDNLDYFNEHFGGIPVKPKGLVLGEINRVVHAKEVRRVKGDPEVMFPEPGVVVLPEETEDQLWIDPGYVHPYAVEFVSIYNEVTVIYDEIYEQFKRNDEIIKMAVRHPRFKHVTKLVMDNSGKTHQQGERSPREAWMEDVKKLTGKSLVPRMGHVNVIDGIARTHVSFSQNPVSGLPFAVISPKCKGLWWEIEEGYKYPLDSEGKYISEKPEDINNDAAKAVAYGLTHNFGLTKKVTTRTVKPAPRRQAGYELLYR